MVWSMEFDMINMLHMSFYFKKLSSQHAEKPCAEKNRKCNGFIGNNGKCIFVWVLMETVCSGVHWYPSLLKQLKNSRNQEPVMVLMVLH